MALTKPATATSPQTLTTPQLEATIRDLKVKDKTIEDNHQGLYVENKALMERVSISPNFSVCECMLTFLQRAKGVPSKGDEKFCSLTQFILNYNTLTRNRKEKEKNAKRIEELEKELIARRA